MQLTHNQSKFSKHQFPIVLVCDHVSNAINIGSLIRVADAFGLEKVWFCGQQIEFNRKAKRTSRAAEKAIKYECTEDAHKVVRALKQNGFQIVSLEITNRSEPIDEFKFSTDHSIALVVGDENFGISETVLSASDAIIHIDMFGQNSSMNVVQAASIALYEITRQLR